MLATGKVGPQALSDGAEGSIRLDRAGAQVITDGHGRYYEASRRGNLFVAYAIVTAPVIWSTAAGTGGPLIWNGTSDKVVNILGLSFDVTTASGAAGSIGFTGGTGQTAAPGSTTAIDGRSNLLMGGSASGSTPYRVGTVTTAGAWFLPIVAVTTATTAVPPGPSYYDIAGLISIPPNGGWASVAASATLTSAVMHIGVVYEEVPA